MSGRNSRISSLRESRVSSSNSIQIGCMSCAISQTSDFCASYVQTYNQTVNYVECKYTKFITSSEAIFQALFFTDRLYVKCQETCCFGWSKSCL